LIDKKTKFFDLCCGSGAVSIELINRGFDVNNIIMLDKSSWGTFWESIGSGRFDINKFLKYANNVPRDKNEIQSYMQQLSKTNANIDEEYKYILLQASSFGGKQIWNENGIWQNTSFRNYWQPTETSKRRSPVNPMQPMIETLIDRIKTIAIKCKGLKCYHSDIYDILHIVPDENCIVYIDPPYSNTTKYGYNFDINDFLSNLFDKTLSPIFVSEKESISDNSIRLNFSGAKGGISGNKKGKNEEWLNIYR
jgi:site-specific DNA-adenine methylase